MKKKTIKGMLSAALALTLAMPSIGDSEVYAANNEKMKEEIKAKLKIEL